MSAIAVPIISSPSLKIYFDIYYRVGLKFCYDKLFTITKSNNNLIIKYKEELLTYSIPIFKDNDTIVNIIKNIINERSFKYKTILYLNDTQKKSKYFSNLSNVLNYIIKLTNHFENVEYTNNIN